MDQVKPAAGTQKYNSCRRGDLVNCIRSPITVSPVYHYGWLYSFFLQVIIQGLLGLVYLARIFLIIHPFIGINNNGLSFCRSKTDPVFIVLDPLPVSV